MREPHNLETQFSVCQVSWDRADSRNRTKRTPENSDGCRERYREDTHRVQKDSEEELAPSDALVQFLGSPGVLFVENGVGEEPAGLSREDLRRGEQQVTRAH